MPSAQANLELLAPAGDWDALRAAVLNGADAVYFGLSDFNARHRAANFTLEELPEVMAYLHGHNVRGFVAFNTLIFSDELERAAQFAAAIAAARVDAVIVQDLGLVRLLHRLVSGLEIHASTQMTLSEPRGISFAAGLGVRRVVLPRELSMADIRAITGATDIPVEVFVHGALCVSYSGQCLTSESLGGRSANRGQCAQACRLPYQLQVDGVTADLGDVAYLLSPLDLAAYDRIGDLAEAGVISFKIEGRLKSPQYVAAAVQAYRSAIDAAARRQPFDLPGRQAAALQQSFSRGFGRAFLDGVNHQSYVHGRYGRHRGLEIGSVVGAEAGGLLVQLTAEAVRQFGDAPVLKPGDGVLFDEGRPQQDEQGGRCFTVQPVPSRTGRPILLVSFANGVNLHAVQPGARVWKTDDPRLERELAASFARERVVHREPVHARVHAPAGGALSLTLRDAAGREACAAWPGPLQPARKHPIDLPTLREQLGRLGDTPFELGSVELLTADAVMVPRSVLNELRREAVAALLAHREGAPIRLDQPHALEELRRDALQRFGPASARPSADTPPSLTLLLRSFEQLDAVGAIAADLPVPLEMVWLDFEDIRRYEQGVAVARGHGLPVGLAGLRICKPGEEGLTRAIARNRPDAFLVRNLATHCLLAEESGDLPRWGDYSLNAANELTTALLLEKGLHAVVPSYDLNAEQFEAMARRIDPGRFELVLHQHMPMFHMEHCVFAHLLSNGADYRTCGRPCEHHRVELRDRAGVDHPLAADAGCRNTLFNGTAQSAAALLPRLLRAGVRRFRVEMLREDGPTAGRLVREHADLLAGRRSPGELVRGLAVLNHFGVTTGTLAYR